MAPPPPQHTDIESTPLLRNERWHGRDDRSVIDDDDDDDDDEEEEEQIVAFEEGDLGNPKNWSMKLKYWQVLQITLVGLLCPLASSILTPANDDVGEEFGVDQKIMIGAQAGFVHLLGLGPLFWAPMSETFGRRAIFLTNLTLFTVMQIPTALASSAPALTALRTITGLFASVGIANGGGTISDMFEASERAPVLGFYLLGPLLGPSLGPFLGGLINSQLHWRWIFWILLIVSTLLTTSCYFFLFETYGPIVLTARKQGLQSKKPHKTYRVDGASDVPISQKILANCSRALRILLTQPIVLVMSIYQAVIFATMYSLYSTFTSIWTSTPYNFSKSQLGLTYLAPATGFTLAAIFVVPAIDRIYKHLIQKHHDIDDDDNNDNDKGVPEYRLPIAQLGATLLPISLFWFGWTVDAGRPWPVPLSATLLFGASQVCIFNSTQNYYIDAFERYAASALAAGAVLRSFMGGQIPLYVDGLFDKYGYGWGMSVFALVAVALMPAPALFYRYGGWVRERFAVDLS